MLQNIQPMFLVGLSGVIHLLLNLILNNLPIQQGPMLCPVIFYVFPIEIATPNIKNALLCGGGVTVTSSVIQFGYL